MLDALEVTGATEGDLADLYEACRRARLDPRLLELKTRRLPISAHAPAGQRASLTIAIGLAKVSVPAVANVVSAWLASRSSPPALRPGHKMIVLEKAGTFSPAELEQLLCIAQEQEA